MPRSKARRALPVVTAVVLADLLTQPLAVRYLVPQRVPHDVVGEWLRLTLVYNPGAAFGLHVGEHSRWVFMVLTVLALGVLASLYRATREGESKPGQNGGGDRRQDHPCRVGQKAGARLAGEPCLGVIVA